MEPEERLTKRERRERARQERREEEVVQKRTSQRRRILTILGTIVGVAAVAGLIWITAEEAAETGILVSRAEAEEAFGAAGCEEPEIPPPPTTAHLEEPAPPADELYPFRPTNAGPHFPNVHPTGTFEDPIDERITTHNMEHGAILAWYDPEQVSDEEIAAMEEWASERNRAGFQARGGAGIIVAPFEASFDSGKSIGMRGWLAAADCDSWDETVADAFAIQNYGTAGQAPEGFLAPYPSDVLQFEGEGDPGDEAPEPEEAPGGHDPEGEEPTEELPEDEEGQTDPDADAEEPAAGDDS